MGIFTRFRDIVSSNINALLDLAEDPEKMVRLMIQEMEDTLIEVKSNCAAVMADQKKAERALDEARRAQEEWDAKAALAVDKDRDDLARAALVEKANYAQRARAINDELERMKRTVAQYHEDIRQLESKLNDARENQRTMIQRRAAAISRRQAQTRIRKIDTSEAFAKFEAYENGIDRLEAEAHLVDSLRPKESLRDEFAKLEHEEEIERELQALKKKAKQEGR